MVINRKKVVNSRKCVWKMEIYGQQNSMFSNLRAKHGFFYEMKCSFEKKIPEKPSHRVSSASWDAVFL